MVHVPTFSPTLRLSDVYWNCVQCMYCIMGKALITIWTSWFGNDSCHVRVVQLAQVFTVQCRLFTSFHKYLNRSQKQK